jgi:haloalkane dehalogenase
MELLRTPDERFRDLPGYDFEPHYVELPTGEREGESLRVHYLEEGPGGADPVLLMHGEPSWSYLYRKMIPPIAAGGHRVVVPDLVGFGRSDKPAYRADHSYQRHVDWMRTLLLEVLDLSEITLVCHDWGGLIGLRLVAEHPERFARVVAANTMLPTGDREPGEAFLAWQKFSQETPSFPVGEILNGACAGQLSPEVVAAYEAPFPDETFKEGARQFPALVPTRPDDPATPANRVAWERLGSFEKPFLTAFSDGDPITLGGEMVLREHIPGAAEQPHTTIRGAGHFLQEQKGEELAAVVLDFIGARSQRHRPRPG